MTRVTAQSVMDYIAC